MERKSILITGAGSGIGRAVARYFAARDWVVGIADNRPETLAETAGPIPVGLVNPYALDVRSRDDWRFVLADFVQIRGRLDVLFNNAGIGVGGPFAETPLDRIDELVDINLRGVLIGAHAAYPLLKATPGSCLLNTCSAAGIYGTSMSAAYSATKFAVRGLTEALDAEWARDGIKVRSLMPSFIDTPLLEGHPVGSNQTIRESVLARRLEITPVEAVAEAAWAAVHGDTVHTLVGKTARRVNFAARWMPGRLRQRMRRRMVEPEA